MRITIVAEFFDKIIDVLVYPIVGVRSGFIEVAATRPHNMPLRLFLRSTYQTPGFMPGSTICDDPMRNL
jgi:hypothetical protein